MHSVMLRYVRVTIIHPFMKLVHHQSAEFSRLWHTAESPLTHQPAGTSYNST